MKPELWPLRFLSVYQEGFGNGPLQLGRELLPNGGSTLARNLHFLFSGTFEVYSFCLSTTFFICGLLFGMGTLSFLSKKL